MSARGTTATTATASVALLLAALAAPTTAAAASAGQDSLVSSKVTVTKAAAQAAGARAGGDALAAYWTAARMKAAVPVEKSPFYQASVQRFGATRQADPSARTGKQTRVAPGKAKEGSPLAKTKGGGDVTAATDPNLSSWHPSARTNGKVFFTDRRDGRNYVCSGAIVNSEGRDTVWTAGHCVHGGGGAQWHANWSFAPSYKDGVAPYGVWTANQLWAMTSWTSSTNYTSDMGVAIMNTRNGWHIVDYFGGHGITWYAPKTIGAIAFGYPAEAPYNGLRLRYCTGTQTQRAWYTPEDTKLPCDMTRGSSGGPHLSYYDGYWGYLNGVNSRIDRIVNPTWSYSPYFDDTASSLYNATRHL